MTNTINQRIGRYFAAPVMATGIIGGAALGLAGTAGAATVAGTGEVRSGIVATPQTKATPAPNAIPGAWWQRHKVWLYPQSTARGFIQPGR